MVAFRGKEKMNITISTEKRKNLSREIWIGLILLSVAICNYLMSLWTGVALDDWVFMSTWEEENGDNPIGLSTLYNFWSEIRQNDNGRIANVMSPIMGLFSPWKELFPIFTGLIMAGIVYAISAFAFGSKGTTPLTVVLAWGATLILPWRNYMYVNDYSLNYLWGIALTILFVGYTVKNEERGWKPLTFFIALLLAFIAGGWHEGIAISALFGLFLLTIVRKFKFSPNWYVLGFFYVGTALWFYFCPGMLRRTNREIGEVALGMNFIKYCVDFLPIIFLIFTLIIELIIPSTRNLLKKTIRNKWFVFGAGVIVMGTFLSMIIAHQPRSAFFPDIMALALIFMLTAQIWRIIQRSDFNTYFTLVMYLVIVAFYCPVLVWQNRFHHESETILKEMEKSENGTVYLDIIPKDSPPGYTLKIPRNNIWLTAFHYWAMKEYFHYPYPAVIPTVLNTDSVAKKGIIYDGNAKAIGYNGLLVREGTLDEDPRTFMIKFTTSSGAAKETPAAVIPYMAPDGKVMSYIWALDGVPENTESVDLLNPVQ